MRDLGFYTHHLPLKMVEDGEDAEEEGAAKCF